MLFALQNAPGERRCGSPGWSARRLEVEAGTAKFDLTLALEETERRAGGGAIEYNTDLFDAGDDRAPGGHFRTLLEARGGRPGGSASPSCRC